jgi:uncharacterized protein (DUF885 family)
MKKAGFIILICALAGCKMKEAKTTYTPEEIAAETKKVNAFLDKNYDEAVARHPETASTLGLKTGYDSWDDRSDSATDFELAQMKAEIDTLHSRFNLKCIDEQAQLSVRMLEDDYSRFKNGVKWRHYGYDVTQMQGVNNDMPAFLLNVHKIDSLSDALAYISRLKKMGRVFDQTIANMKKSEAAGVLPPYFTFHYVKDDMNVMLKSFDKSDASNVFLTDFKTKVDSLKIDGAEKDKLIAEAAGVIKTDVKGAYQRLLDYWLYLEPKAKANGSKGVWSLPDGDKFYAYCLEEHTTTKMTPDEVYNRGLSEVARIHKEMHTIMKQVNFKSDSLQEFFAFVRTDKQFKYSNDDKGRAALLADANRYIDSMRVKLPDLFGTLPKAKLIVKQVEKFREKSAGGAFYEDPAEDGTRPGRYYVNTYDMSTEPKYQMEALTYHEAIPGHHMQISIAQELKNLPKFRKHEGYTAYVEGWALYAEQLGKEVGKYQDPYSDFGRLSMEVFRAARLVVDVGIHTRHWTREQAIDYFEKNTANAPRDIENEIERYFIWPGQATGYKTGMMKILELRTKAQKELGNKFDIRQFHDVVITNGAVPLTVLEELVDKWIAEKKKAN